MISRIEIALKKELRDAEASALIRKAASYFGIRIEAARCIHIVTIESDLSSEQLATVKDEIFTNPVTQISGLAPLDIDFDWCIWIGFRPGVKDNAGATAVEAIQDHTGKIFTPDEGIYTSKRYCLTGESLTYEDMEKLASELLSNSIIQQFKIFSFKDWDKRIGADVKPAKVILDHTPCFEVISIASDEQLAKISDERNLALNPRDIPVIREYFLDPGVIESRKPSALAIPPTWNWNISPRPEAIIAITIPFAACFDMSMT